MLKAAAAKTNIFALLSSFKAIECLIFLKCQDCVACDSSLSSLRVEATAALVDKCFHIVNRSVGIFERL